MTELVDVRVESLSKIFPTREGPKVVLEDIGFSVMQGDFLTIVGPSGGGKTTLIRILAGLDNATSGNVELSSQREKEGVAFVEQSPLLLPWRTLLQNAALGLELRERLTTVNLARVNDLLFDFGLVGFNGYRPSELSGGMRQRVAVIRALAPKPAIMFCDEPFSSVDFVQRLELNREFRHRCGIDGITTIFVTHNIDEAIFLGHRVMVLGKNPGRIVETYPVPESISAVGPVACRQLPEFQKLFAVIWKDLREISDGKK